MAGWEYVRRAGEYMALGGFLLGLMTALSYTLTVYTPVAARTVDTPLLKTLTIVGLGLLAAGLVLGFSNDVEADPETPLERAGTVAIMAGILLYYVAVAQPQHYDKTLLAGSLLAVLGTAALSINDAGRAPDTGDGVPDDPEQILEDGDR